MYVDTKIEVEWKSISTIVVISMGVRSLKSSFVMVVALAEMFVVIAAIMWKTHVPYILWKYFVLLVDCYYVTVYLLYYCRK